MHVVICSTMIRAVSVSYHDLLHVVLIVVVEYLIGSVLLHQLEALRGASRADHAEAELLAELRRCKTYLQQIALSNAFLMMVPVN